MRARFLIPLIYLAVAVYVWMDFVGTNPDGLANVGLFILTLPVAIVGLALTEIISSGRFVLLPSGFGYYANHALYYWPSVLVTWMLLYWITAALSRPR